MKQIMCDGVRVRPHAFWTWASRQWDADNLHYEPVTTAWVQRYCWHLLAQRKGELDVVDVQDTSWSPDGSYHRMWVTVGHYSDKGSGWITGQRVLWTARRDELQAAVDLIQAAQ